MIEGSSGGGRVATEDETIGLDTSALIGLRGVLALHILIYHCFLKAEASFNLVATIELPLFFIISGFTLALSEGHTLWGAMPCCAELVRRGVR